MAETQAENATHSRNLIGEAQLRASRLQNVLLTATEAVAALHARQQNLDVANSRLSAAESTILDAKRDVAWASDDVNEIGDCLGAIIEEIRKALADHDAENIKLDPGTDVGSEAADATQALRESSDEYDVVAGGEHEVLDGGLSARTPSPPKSSNEAEPQGSQAADLRATSNEDGISDELKAAEAARELCETMALHQRLAFLEVENEALQTSLTAVYASTSWRLTAPVRTVARFLGAGRR